MMRSSTPNPQQTNHPWSIQYVTKSLGKELSKSDFISYLQKTAKVNIPVGETPPPINPPILTPPSTGPHPPTLHHPLASVSLAAILAEEVEAGRSKYEEETCNKLSSIVVSVQGGEEGEGEAITDLLMLCVGLV